MKQIVINGRFFSQAITGVQRYSRELLRELDNLLASRPPGADPVEVLVPKNVGQYPPYKSLLVRQVGRFTGQAWEQIDLPLHCRGKLLFTPCGGAPILHSCNVITIHDAAVFATPATYSRAYVVWYRWLFSRLGRTARYVLTVSEFSKSELIRYCKIDPSKISVTLEGCDHVAAQQPDSSILQERGLTKSSYVLAVSSHNPNKNFQGVIRAMKFLQERPVSFVIAGDINARVFGETEELPDSVLQVGRVSDAQLRALYEEAGCFVYPSFYEGFGLPPLEAMASGCPVIVGDIPALRETCGDAAEFCDPHVPSSIATAISEVMTDGHLRRNLVERGLLNARQFQWQKTAIETWKILEEVASNDGSASLSEQAKVRPGTKTGNTDF